MRIETSRLTLRKLEATDSQFIYELLNDAAFIKYIGDRGIRTLAEAEKYIVEGPVHSYIQNGYGLFAVEIKKSKKTIGICGLVKRDIFKAPDVGFAFLEKYRQNGYALEAAQATMSYARHDLNFKQVLGITSPENASSIVLLKKLGLQFVQLVKLSPDKPEAELYATRPDLVAEMFHKSTEAD